MKLRRRKRGKNIIHLQKSLKEFVSDLKMSRQDLQKRVETIRRKLFGHREKRIHPGKDGKVTAYVCIDYIM